MVPGQILGGRYLLIRELGRGGMGMVFEAHDSVLDRNVAIKVLPDRALGAAARARLRREARIVAKMDHPCVVPVYDLVDDDDGLFVVMPVLRGSTLRELLQGGPLTAPFAATVAMQVASALEYSHELGVIHRDIKPDNIMTLGSSQGTLAVKVMDFGVACTLEDTTDIQPGGVVGTIEYLSPEQVKGVEVGAHSDVYALGVLLYECLVGRPPFTGSMMDVMHRVINEAPKRLRDSDPNIPEVLDKLVAKCLQKTPGARPSLRLVQNSLSRVPMATVAPRAPITRRSIPVIVSSERSDRLVRQDRQEHPEHGDRQERPPSPEAIGNEVTAFIQPLAGREDELYALSGCVAKAKRGQLQMCLISGPPGIGKSRLVFELGRVADSRGVPMYWGHYRGGEEALPYHALCEIIQAFCEREPREGTSLAGLRELSAELRVRFPVLASVASLRRLAESQANHRITHDPLLHEQHAPNLPLFELLARTFMIIGQGRPMIIALDDLHRADISIDALAYLSRRLEATPTILVATYQPNESTRVANLLRTIDIAGMGERFRQIELAPLDRESHDELVHHVMGEAAMAPDAAERLYQAADGVPLAIRELLLGLRDAGALRLDHGSWQLDSEHFLHARLPATLPEIVRLRLSSLTQDARALLANSTVLGEPFTAADLALVAPQRAFRQSLAEILRAGFLIEESRTGERALAFANDLVREALQDGVSRREQARLHQCYAEGLLKREPEPSMQTAHALARHFAGAGMLEQALLYGLEAAKNALDAGGPEQAVRTARIVLVPFDSSLDDSSERPAAGQPWSVSVQGMVGRVRMVLHEALHVLGQTDDAHIQAERAQACFDAAGDRTGRLGALSALAVLDWRERHVRNALHSVESSLSLVAELDSDERAALTDSLVSLAHVGRMAAAAAGEEELLTRLQSVFGHLPSVRARSDAGIIAIDTSGQHVLDGVQLLTHGEYQAALAAVRELENRAGQRTPLELRDEVRRRLHVAELSYQLGRYDDVISQCTTARRILGDDDPLIEATLLSWQSLAHAAGGHFEDANHNVRDAFASLALHVDNSPAGRQVVLAQLFRSQGTILLGRGRPLEALAAFERSVELSEDGSRAHSIALFCAGHTCVEAGQYQQAADYLARSEAAKTALQDRWGLAHNHAAWVTLLLDHGEILEARERVGDGLRFSAEIGDPKIMAWLRWGTGRVFYMLGESSRAERELQLGLRDAYSCGAKPETNRLHLALTRVHRGRGHHALAWSHAEQARELAHTGGSSIEQADVHLLIGLLRMDRGDLAAAAELLDTATALSDSVGNPYRQLDAGIARVELDIARRRHGEARSRLDELYPAALELGARVHAATIWRTRATLHEQCGARDEAARAARRAQEDFLSMSLPAGGVS